MKKLEYTCSDPMVAFGMATAYKQVLDMVSNIMQDCPQHEEADRSFNAGFFAGVRSLADRLESLIESEGEKLLPTEPVK